MKTDLLRHTEIFIFLAMVFSIYTAALLIDKHKLLNDNVEIKNKNEDLENKLEEYINNTPPHIEIDGTQEFYFELGESLIIKEFKNYLRDSLVPKLIIDLEKCKSCNALYIVGHTDDTRATQKKNNIFDEQVLEAMTGRRSMNFDYNSNTDLGLQRAISIYRHLHQYKELNQIKYWFPYSAGPFINPNDSYLIKKLNPKDKKYNERKRRIEVWLYAYKSGKRKPKKNVTKSHGF